VGGDLSFHLKGEQSILLFTKVGLREITKINSID
jgi:hypothetical protein